MNIPGQKRSLSAFTNKKKAIMGLKQGHIMNNIKTINPKNQILPSQSQKNINSPMTPNRKVEIKTRPNTGGSKTTIRVITPTMSYKDRSRFSNQKNDLNASNVSVNNSHFKGLNDRKNDRSLSPSIIERNGMRVPNLNFSKLNGSKSPVGGLGPKTSRDLLKNKIQNMVNSKSNSKLNDSSMNNSVNDVFKSISTNRNNGKSLAGGHRINLTPSKNIKTSNSKSPNQKQTYSSSMTSNMKKPKFPNKTPNFSKLNVMNNIPNDSKKNSIEQIEVQVTNNMKQRIQPKGFTMNSNNANKKNVNSIANKKFEDGTISETRQNKFSNKNLVKNSDFKAINTSPLVKKKFEVDSIKVNKESDISKNLGQNYSLNKSSSEQKIEVVSKVNETPSVIKSIKSIFDITKTGFAGVGQKKTNQDNFFIHKNFNNNPNSIFMGVCDGHGVVGHEVSLYLRENLPVYLDSEIKKKNTNINKIITESFNQINFKLCNETIIDTNFSGSTCVTVIYTPEKLICANVGDSRAVLGRLINGNWVNHDLSRDHKPSDKDESIRIINRNGRVEPFRDENGEFIGPARVWLKEDDIPGLAMSRSFGDQVAASVGCISEPEIKEWKLTKDDMFFVIASDGVWEFIESDELVNIVKEYYLKNNISGAAEYLVKEATRRWMKEEEVIDDITLILVFFN